MTGRIKYWNLIRGFGFIQAPNGRDYFCNIKNWSKPDAPTVGTQVEFDLQPGFKNNKNNPEAANVRPASGIDAGADALRAGAESLVDGAA